MSKTQIGALSRRISEKRSCTTWPAPDTGLPIRDGDTRLIGSFFMRVACYPAIRTCGAIGWPRFESGLKYAVFSTSATQRAIWG